MSEVSSAALERASRVRLMIFDVDGVLTDGRLWYGPAGEALKAFHTLDGHGIKMLAQSGVVPAILSGRRSQAVAQRAAELGVEHVLQGIEDKRSAYAALLAQLGMQAEATGYAGDDVMDLPVLVRCGLACAPREAPQSVRQRVHYVCESPAGAGAVREICEFVMRARGSLEAALARYLA
ncbi:MAG TPA: HAD family hydrolase [Burkholderiales bacterium]|nr:HAD family hydrolase [Burkholderiales bacterium]